ncbi:hypothetical protein [Tenacibaculum sp. MAR_2009_124]|uniref:hypothetical protein n=1 Tax=Tenacibaculum sp. MAR_2009_124 TaxID=1250059 RepID=UPI00115FCCF3|nr:hypothetical protein [Tenacibaculum sp. MAR_2009_124]
MNPSIAQEKISDLLRTNTLELKEVESYMRTNNIIPLSCEEDHAYGGDVDHVKRAKTFGFSTKPIEAVYVFNVYFHILNDNNGYRDIPITEEHILEAVSILNKSFNPFKIFFKYKGYGHINNTWRSVVYLGGNRTFNQLIDYSKGIDKYRSDSFNIFIASSIRRSQYDQTRIAGVANKPGINTVIDDEYLLTSTFPHEIGHNFNLFHTHHNWNKNNCELVRRNDFVEDTLPSVPYSSDDLIDGCSSELKEIRNKCGIEIRQVPSSNFMSSNVMPCRSLDNALFTQGQGKRMRLSIHEQISPMYMGTQNSVESLYEPFKGNYDKVVVDDSSDSDNTNFKFQKGFDYEFVDCYDTNEVEESFSKDEIPNIHPPYTAIKILQISSEEAFKCHIPREEQEEENERIVISFGAIIGNNYTTHKIKYQFSKEKEFYKRIPLGFNLIKTKNKYGQTVQKMIYKSQ